jgi:hypothetical protein
MLSFKEYFQLNESVQSVELMSTILNEKPMLDQWMEEYHSTGGEDEWGDFEYFLEESVGIDGSDVDGLVVNLKLFKAPARIKSILDKATARIPEKFRIILNDMVQPNFIGSTKLPENHAKFIQPSKDAITLVISPTNDPITVWMISHRVGHAIEDNLKEAHREVEYLVRKYINDFRHIHGGDEDNYNKLSGFRSAATNNVNSFYEYINDLIGQYCHNGRVEFIMPDLGSIKSKDVSNYKSEKLKIETKINNVIKSSLVELHGRVLVA